MPEERRDKTVLACPRCKSTSVRYAGIGDPHGDPDDEYMCQQCGTGFVIGKLPQVDNAEQ